MPPPAEPAAAAFGGKHGAARAADAAAPCAAGDVLGADVRHEGAWLAAILGVALVLRAWVAHGNPVIFDDGPAFIDIARAMARGDVGWVLAHPYHPLYSLLIWLTPGSGGHEEAVGIGWSVACGTASVAALWWLMRPLFGSSVALTAAALWAAHPYAVRFAGDVQSDQLHLLLFLLAAAVGQRALASARAGPGLAAGCLSALAYLTRPEGLGVLVVMIALAVAGVMRRRWSLRRGIGFVGASVAGFALLAGPYLAGIAWVAGELRLTQKKSLLELLGLARLGEWGSSGAELVVPVGVLALAVGLAWATRARLAAWATVLCERRFGVVDVATVVGCALLVVCLAAPMTTVELAALFASTLRPELLLLLAIGVGWCATRGDPPSGRAFFFLFFTTVYGVAAFGLLETAGYLDRRHLVPMTVMLLGYCALGVHVLARAWARRRTGDAGRAVVVIVLLCMAIALPKALRASRSEEVAAREAAEWVGGVAAPGDRIASERPKSAYYAGLVWIPLHDAEGLREGAELRRLGARWVLAGSRDLAPDDPRRLASPPAPGQRFELVFEVEREGHRAVVFEVHEPALDWQQSVP